jgi:hypothetical protein
MEQRKAARARAAPVPRWTVESPSAFEAVTREMVETLSEELREIRHRIDGLLWMLAGAILLDIGARLLGT